MHRENLPATLQSHKTGYALVRYLLLALLFSVFPNLHADGLETEATKELSSAVGRLSLEIKINGTARELYPENMLVDEFSGTEKGRLFSGYQRIEAYEISYTVAKEINNAAIELKIEIKSAVDAEMPVVNLKVHSGQLAGNETQHGFASLYSYLKPILVNHEDQIDLENDTEIDDRACLKCWMGYRTQSEAYLVLDKSEEISTVTINNEAVFKPLALTRVKSTQADASGETYLATVLVYKGPVEYKALLSTNDKSLMNMLYSHLWDWVRSLVFAVKTLSYFLFSLLGNWGLTIIFLAFCLRIIILPISLLAEKYQKQAIQNQQLLKPAMSKIKNEYKGEEQSIQLFKLYESHGIHPLSGLKGLLGLAIQLPILLAIFAFLSEMQPINGVSFLWINDLSLPDSLFKLPFVIPFFGGTFNLLPFIMLLISNLSSFIGIDPTLSSDALRSQRKNTFLISLLFFVLFYSFPAAMVLYWSSSVFFEVVQRNIMSKLDRNDEIRPA